MTKAGSQMINNLFGGATSAQVPTKEEKVWQVSEILNQAKRSLEKQFHQVAIVGEISSFKPWRSGHWYFNLKDKNCSLNAIMFRNANQRVVFEVEEGQEVLARGRISVYPERSQVQFIVERLEPIGEGALALAFEQMKTKLQKEGLFNADIKKSIPSFPLRIGLVTSPQGAALRDMLRVMKQRWPGVQFVLSPTRVQGQGADQEIANALTLLDKKGTCDVIVLSRGGGSLSDLWSFNEERLARAIYKTKTPVISAVGHATDTTIADFVADLAVATPTHAASILPDKSDIDLTLKRAQQQLQNTITSHVQNLRKQLELNRQQLTDPRLRILQSKQSLDDKERRAQQALLRHFGIQKKKLEQLERQLRTQHPYQILNNQKDKLTRYHHATLKNNPQSIIKEKQRSLGISKQKIDQAIKNRLRQSQQNLALHAAALESLSPLSILSRGYALIQKDDETDQGIVSRIDQLRKADKVKIQLSDGIATAQITQISNRKDVNHDN